jgi:hypothetical protein
MTSSLVKTYQVTDLETGETIATHYEDWRGVRHAAALNDKHARETGDPRNRHRFASVLVYSTESQ